MEALSQFFRPRIETGFLGFPDHYFCLLTNESELRRRKEADQTRTRRSFDAHLRLMQVQPRYFGVLSGLAPGRVHWIDAESVETNTKSIRDKIAAPLLSPPNDLALLFDGLMEWLRSNKA